MLLGTLKADAMSFEEAFSETSRTPMLVLLYADWADGYKLAQEQFKVLETEFGSTFNFAELDIAKPEAKAFNDKFHIYPKLPYVLMFRNGGKISRYVHRECALDLSCIRPKIKSFIQ